MTTPNITHRNDERRIAQTWHVDGKRYPYTIYEYHEYNHDTGDTTMIWEVLTYNGHRVFRSLALAECFVEGYMTEHSRDES